MKNGGGFRVIKNDKIAISIMSYSSMLPRIQSLEQTQKGQDYEFRKIPVQIFSAVVFNQINSSEVVLKPVNNPLFSLRRQEING